MLTEICEMFEPTVLRKVPYSVGGAFKMLQEFRT